jgi:hypothetical protein
MNDISNRTLATLLIAAIVVSLGGTLLSINKLTQRPVSLAQTGRAVSDLGTAQVSIQESLSIILLTDSVDFGTGYVNMSNTNCAVNNVNLSTLGAGFDYEDCFVGGGTGTDFVLQNNGNINASVSVRGPSKTDLFGTANPLVKAFRWKASDAPAEDADVEVGSCQGLVFNKTWTPFSNNATVCDDLDYGDSTDTIAVLVNMRFPWNQSTGLYTNSSITFYAVKS